MTLSRHITMVPATVCSNIACLVNAAEEGAHSLALFKVEAPYRLLRSHSSIEKITDTLRGANTRPRSDVVNTVQATARLFHRYLQSGLVKKTVELSSVPTEPLSAAVRRVQILGQETEALRHIRTWTQHEGLERMLRQAGLSILACEQVFDDIGAALRLFQQNRLDQVICSWKRLTLLSDRLHLTRDSLQRLFSGSESDSQRITEELALTAFRLSQDPWGKGNSCEPRSLRAHIASVNDIHLDAHPLFHVLQTLTHLLDASALLQQVDMETNGLDALGNLSIEELSRLIQLLPTCGRCIESSDLQGYLDALQKWAPMNYAALKTRCAHVTRILSTIRRRRTEPIYSIPGKILFHLLQERKLIPTQIGHPTVRLCLYALSFLQSPQLTSSEDLTLPLGFDFTSRATEVWANSLCQAGLHCTYDAQKHDDWLFARFLSYCITSDPALCPEKLTESITQRQVALFDPPDFVSIPLGPEPIDPAPNWYSLPTAWPDDREVIDEAVLRYLCLVLRMHPDANEARSGRRSRDFNSFP